MKDSRSERISSRNWSGMQSCSGHSRSISRTFSETRTMYIGFFTVNIFKNQQVVHKQKFEDLLRGSHVIFKAEMGYPRLHRRFREKLGPPRNPKFFRFRSQTSFQHVFIAFATSIMRSPRETPGIGLQSGITIFVYRLKSSHDWSISRRTKET